MKTTKFFWAKVSRRLQGEQTALVARIRCLTPWITGLAAVSGALMVIISAVFL